MHLSESGTPCGVWAWLWLSALPCERAAVQCRDEEWVQLLKNVMILLRAAAMNERSGPGCHYTFSTSTMLFRPQMRRAWRVISEETQKYLITWSLGTKFRELVALSLIWGIQRRTTVQSQFMLKSSTQIMFKQMQTKFVGKPLLHFPPNLIKTLKLIRTIVWFLEYEL